MLETISEARVAQLRDEGATVLCIEGNVYVVGAEFTHPGGAEVLRAHSGQDVTDLFLGSWEGAHAHSRGAHRLLSQYLVGRLAGAPDGSGAGQPEAGQRPAANPPEPAGWVPQEGDPMLRQVGRMRGTDYQAWVHTPAPGQPRFFESDLAESLTKVKWWVVPLLWLPLAALFFIRAARSASAPPPAAWPALVAGGVVAWQLLEYCLHRFLFHQAPSSPRTIFLHFLLHGCHHRYPMDTERLVFPPVPASWVAAAVYAAIRAALPAAAAGMVFSGVLFGYVAYDVGHYLMHSGRLGGRLKAAHMHHHYADPTSGFGISSPLFDVLFRTLPAAKAAAGARVKLA